MVVILQRTFREIMFLQELNNHENIIKCVFVESLGGKNGKEQSSRLQYSNRGNVLMYLQKCVSKYVGLITSVENVGCLMC